MVEPTGGPAHAGDVPTIAELLKNHMSATGASYGDLSRQTDGALGVAHLQKMRELPIKEFPKPRTIQLLSDLLHVNVTTVVLAFATSLGLPVRRSGTMMEVTLPPGTDDLTVEDREAIRSITRQLVDARRQGVPPEPDYMQVQGLLLREADPEEPTGEETPGGPPRQRRNGP